MTRDDDQGTENRAPDGYESRIPQAATDQDLRRCLTDEREALEPAAEAATRDAIARIQDFKGSRRYDVKLVEAENGRVALAPSNGRSHDR